MVCGGSGLKRHVIQNYPPSKAQETLSSDFIDSDKVPTADIKLEPLFLRGFFEKIGSRWILLWVALRQGPIKVWNLVRTATALISPCFQKAWTGIKGIRITANFSNRLRKLVYYNISIWRRCGPSPITSSYHHFFYALQKTSNAPGKKFPNSNDFHAGFNIVVYYSLVHAPCLPPLCIHFSQILGKWRHISVTTLHYTPFFSGTCYQSAFVYIDFGAKVFVPKLLGCHLLFGFAWSRNVTCRLDF